MTAIQELRSSFEDIVDRAEVPAADFLESLLRILRNADAAKVLREAGLAAAESDRVIRAYTDDPIRFVEQTSITCASLRSEFQEAAKRKLDSLTGFFLINIIEKTQAEKMISLFDNQHQLLNLGVANDFISKLPDGFSRAKQLSAWAATVSSSEQADLYLKEACSCFLYGFDTACVILCRALLEEILERYLSNEMLAAGARWTLGSLLQEVEANLAKRPIPRQARDLMEAVNKVGSTAAHRGSANELIAIECLRNTRTAVLILFSWDDPGLARPPIRRAKS